MKTTTEQFLRTFSKDFMYLKFLSDKRIANETALLRAFKTTIKIGNQLPGQSQEFSWRQALPLPS